MKPTTNLPIWQLLQTIYDPEIPVLSIVDMGMVRSVELNEEQVVISITPTYSGCPAMDIISMQIRMSLLEAGYKNIVLKQLLSPAWTTDWISQNGKDQLKAYGIAAPVGKSTDNLFLNNITIECPQCNSSNTVLVSQFGSTACKALYKCNDCMEPFDYFKCH